MIGPVDYIVLGFKGNSFDGSIMDKLSTAVKNNTIRVVDLVFIIKDESGDVVAGEYEDQSGEIHEMLGEVTSGEKMPLLSETDIEKIGSEMDNNTAAAVLVFEHLWAKGLKQSIINAGGFLIAEGRIHKEAVETAIRELEAQPGK